MKYFVYVIASIKPFVKTYVGWTNNINKRIEKHNLGKGAKSTRGRKWKLIYKEKFDSKINALKREYKIKKDKNFRRILKKRKLNIGKLN
jgi:putative endonuclease